MQNFAVASFLFILSVLQCSFSRASPTNFETYAEFRRHFRLPRFGLHDTNSIHSAQQDAFPSVYKYTTRWFNATLDHFNFANTGTFPLRYLVNDDHFGGPGAPIFLYTGNEGDIEWFARNTGFMWEIAPEFQASVVFVEHRYYGLSLPFGNSSYADPKRLGFLTSEQVRIKGTSRGTNACWPRGSRRSFPAVETT